MLSQQSEKQLFNEHEIQLTQPLAISGETARADTVAEAAADSIHTGQGGGDIGAGATGTNQTIVYQKSELKNKY